MAVGSAELPELHPVDGVSLGVASAGIKKPGRLDLVVIELAEGTSVAGVFTTNAFCAAPVQIAKQHLDANSPRYLVINTGNANAGTGAQGLSDCLAVCQQLAAETGLEAQHILPFSTGVIGEPLPVEKIVAGLPDALADLSTNGWEKAAVGIMTTDTRPKATSRQFTFQGETITVTGIAKGAGMIKPNMATMLAYVATDANVEPALLNQILQKAVNLSFNRITIDGDTSTNDACMLIASGKSGFTIKNDHDEGYQQLVDVITLVCCELAQGLVRDGEGATKFVTVNVAGGRNEQECLQAAYAIAESPLVKTALFASDPNWGRLLAAIGYAGIDELDVNQVTVGLNDVVIAENGARAKSYTEAEGQRVMNEEEITIQVNLSRGDAAVTVWTSDLSHDYVKINAEYRT